MSGLIKACLNGNREPGAHPALPITPEQLAADGAAAVAAGAQALHLHPRGADGRESLAAVDDTVRAVKAAVPGVPVGVSTGAWIEPDVARRVDLVRGWRTPDVASVNLSEPGAVEVMRALLEAGVGIEAGVWDVADAERLAASGLAARVQRILVEPVDLTAAQVPAAVGEIHAALDRLDLRAPRLQHGDGEATWVLIADAVRRGLDTRVGLEDTLAGPDGEPAAGNQALVRAARALGAGADAGAR
jgi:uncharacterized protein (DUF849 family)